METNFTPGPWKRDGVIIWGDTRPVAQCVFLDTRYPLDSDWANAHLMTASPDLYNGTMALLGLLTLVASRDDVSPEIREALTSSHRIDEANAALSKARGDNKPTKSGV